VQFAKQTSKLSNEDRLRFYEILAHNLTVAIRGVWANESISDSEKVDRIKWINEILHRVTANVWVLRLKTHEWTEEDFGQMIRGYVGENEGIKEEVFAAFNRSYQAVTGEEIG
jgi:hypothetical protein